MGQSTDAYLFWGFCIGDEDEERDEDDDGDKWEERYAVAKGVPLPPEFSDETKEAWRAFWGKQREVIKEGGCELDSHCSCDSPMSFVKVSASFTRACRGDPKPIANLDVGADWEEKLRAFCETMNIEWQTPGWWLASNWC